ncbi:RNAse P Rpr2/Rpp21/SNM1 subunit domain-containing protein [Lyophyllum atratum]|nr:RNAse P Rpr2/Rpp21/SNM1 subunit domain-containing protein [Lyophyllum atratum]
MAKKNRDEVPTANSVANRDIIQRLNFLYQASVYLNTVPSQQQSSSTVSNAVPIPSTTPNAVSDGTTREKKEGKKPKKRANAAKRAVTASDLARTYIATMKIVGQKTTVKIDPAVKRTLCKGCNMTLIPGTTASIRVKKSSTHGHTMVYTCTACNTSLRIPAPPTPRVEDIPSPLISTVAPPAPISSTSLVVPAIPIEEAMDVEPVLRTEAAGGATRGRGKRKRVQPRLPPLFARDVGHVVYRGNERLVDEGHGDGVYII